MVPIGFILPIIRIWDLSSNTKSCSSPLRLSRLRDVPGQVLSWPKETLAGPTISRCCPGVSPGAAHLAPAPCSPARQRGAEGAHGCNPIFRRIWEPCCPQRAVHPNKEETEVTHVLPLNGDGRAAMLPPLGWIKRAVPEPTLDLHSSRQKAAFFTRNWITFL